MKILVSLILIINCLLSMFEVGCGLKNINQRTSSIYITNGTSQSTKLITSDTIQTIEASSIFTPTTEVIPFDTTRLGTVEKDIIYATVDGIALKMDIYYPKAVNTFLPAVVYVHGGGWTSGDKSTGAGSRTIPELLSRGYLVASINYRLAPQYKIQSQIEDIKCAIRFLRAKASDYGIDKEHIGAIGGSAGGHLVSLLGTSDVSAELEGSGGYHDQSSRVQAVVDLFGPADLVTMFQNYSAAQLKILFGTNSPYSDVVRKVSPVNYITADDPPFLILHGDKDAVVPPIQSEILYRKLTDAKVPATLVIVKNAGHVFTPVGEPISPSQDEINILIADFFDRYLKSQVDY